MTTQAHTTNPPKDPLSEYVHYSEIPRYYPRLITPNRIHWMIRNRDANGLDEHVLKVGNTLFVHLPSFADWLDSQRGLTE
jgi:hypothetical protein